jgi:HEPN domain-containing protein
MPSSRILPLTRRARELAVDAIEQCQVEFKAHESLRSMLDSTSALLQEAQSAVAASTDVEARRLLEAGIWQLDRAREAYRAGDYRRAILLGGAARNLVQRARDRARGVVDDAGPGSRLDAALDRTDALLAEVRGVAGLREDARARALFEKAEREQEQARTLRERGVPVAALRRTQSARASAMDALWRVQRAPDPRQLRDAADMVGRLLDQISPEIRASGSGEALGLLEKAAEQLRAARAELAGGNMERAAKAVRTADSLLRRAAEKAAR